MAVIVRAQEQLSSHDLTIVVTSTSDFANDATALAGIKGHVAHANIGRLTHDRAA